MEVIEFPDRTSREFYASFNGHLLRSLGLLPTRELLDDLFLSCSHRPWSAFADTGHLRDIKLPIGVLSNWDNTLINKLALIEGVDFRWVIGSAETGSRKPDPEFFAKVLEVSGLLPEEVAYVGDSVRLDIEPARRLGLRAVLIDRDGCFPNSNIPRIAHLGELRSIL
jgi:HAD superfamily hydrolase (TIGR01509 family)